MDPLRRRLVGAWLAAAAGVPAPATGRRIEVAVRRFEFEPSVVDLVVGESVILALRCEDFAHGFAIPDLSVRVDLVPGRIHALMLVAAHVGSFTILCDNFCGEGHDRMTGLLRVAAR